MKPKDALENAYLLELRALLNDDDADESEVWYNLHDEAITADGCSVEPDGTCEHGYQAPLLLLGMI